MKINYFEKIQTKYSFILRDSKKREFFRLLHPSSSDTLLDVGGNVGIRGLSSIRSYFRKSFVLDLDEEAMHVVKRQNNAIPIVGDGCFLPFRDKSFDFVFSNAVIEHIPKGMRLNFAPEIERIARKGYFVITPSFWFPYEPHYQLPFGQFLPENLKKQMVTRHSVGYIQKGQYEKIDLLTAKELNKYFQKATVGNIKMSSVPIPPAIYAARRCKT